MLVVPAARKGRGLAGPDRLTAGGLLVDDERKITLALECGGRQDTRQTRRCRVDFDGWEGLWDVVSAPMIAQIRVGVGHLRLVLVRDQGHHALQQQRADQDREQHASGSSQRHHHLE